MEKKLVTLTILVAVLALVVLGISSLIRGPKAQAAGMLERDSFSQKAISN